jgi:hypothetical protein
LESILITNFAIDVFLSGLFRKYYIVTLLEPHLLPRRTGPQWREHMAAMGKARSLIESLSPTSTGVAVNTNGVAEHGRGKRQTEEFGLAGRKGLSYVWVCAIDKGVEDGLGG